MQQCPNGFPCAHVCTYLCHLALVFASSPLQPRQDLFRDPQTIHVCTAVLMHWCLVSLAHQDFKPNLAPGTVSERLNTDSRAMTSRGTELTHIACRLLESGVLTRGGLEAFCPN